MTDSRLYTELGSGRPHQSSSHKKKDGGSHSVVREV